MAEYEVEFGVPGDVAFSYVHIKVGSHDPNELLSAMQKAREIEVEARALHSAMLKGEGSTQEAAGALIKSELGGTVVSYAPPAPAPVPTGNPWDSAPAAPTGNPWDNASPGGWTPPVRDFFLIDVPRDRSELWGGPKGPDGKAVKGGGLRGKLQAGGIKIDWNAEEKRNTIPKNADPAALDYIRSQGIELK